MINGKKKEKNVLALSFSAKKGKSLSFRMKKKIELNPERRHC